MSNLVEHWSVNDVAAWLKEIGLEKHSDLFRKHEINGEILLTMKENDLSSPPLNVREFGTVRKFSLRLEQLKLLQNKPSVTVENVTIKVEKVTKVEPAVYRSDLEAFLAGEPCYDEDAYSDEEEPKPKTKKLRQIKREIMLKAQGKLPIPEIEQIFTDNVTGVQFVKDYAKQSRPPKGVTRVYVVKVISFREIYLRTDSQNETLKTIEQKLQSLQKNNTKVTPLSDRLLEGGVACAFLDDDGRWYRGRIGEVGPGDSDIPVVLVDYGRTVFTSRSNRNRFITALPAADKLMLKEIQIYKCKLYKLCDLSATNADLSLLKEFLPVGMVFNCYFERDREPWRVHLEYPDSVNDFVEVFEQQSGRSSAKKKQQQQQQQR